MFILNPTISVFKNQVTHYLKIIAVLSVYLPHISFSWIMKSSSRLLVVIVFFFGGGAAFSSFSKH